MDQPAGPGSVQPRGVCAARAGDRPRSRRLGESWGVPLLQTSAGAMQDACAIVHQVNPDLPHRCPPPALNSMDVAAVCPGFLSPSSPIQRASMRSQPMLAGRCQTPQPHSVSCSGGTLPLCDRRRTAKKEPAKPSQASTLELCPVIVAVKHRLSALLSQRGLASHRLTSNKTRSLFRQTWRRLIAM